uniref:Fibrinogen C-terminal domain-containing protein n=1 Tax=Xenopus tropicalis TaxID=8364 RepID=A0A1B8XUK9_XENTR
MAQCGEYSSQVLANGKCKIVATLPQHEGHRCPDMFRCTEEVSYWLHENKERKQEVLELRELVFELQEELRNHRHRLKVLEIQHSRSCHTDCSSLYYNGIDRSGIYTIELAAGGIPTDVLCDMETDGGGWTIIQSRQDGSVGFNRTWAEYKEGFGHLNGEFWLGNENIYRITSRGDYSLRIDMEDWDGNHKYAMYRSFSIEDEGNHYRLNVEGFSGTTEDSFAWYHNKRSFSTPETGNLCAEISHGGWWYHQCFYSNLNGVYYRGGGYMRGRGALGPDGIVWYGWRNTDYYSLKRVSMKIRSRAFRLHRSL